MVGANLSLLAAFGLGVLHALEPSHGKPLLLLQMVAGRMSWKRSFFIILVSVVTHFLMVGSLTFLIASFFQFGVQNDVLSENSEKTFGVISGVLLMGYGFWLWRNRHKHCHHDHQSKCAGGHDHTRKQDFIFGFITGLLPCPTSWVVVSNAVNVHDPVLALSWLAWFCLGMIVVLLGLGALIAAQVSKIQTAKLQSHGFEVKLISAQAVLVMALGVFQLWGATMGGHSHETFEIESDHVEGRAYLPTQDGAS